MIFLTIDIDLCRINGICFVTATQAIRIIYTTTCADIFNLDGQLNVDLQKGWNCRIRWVGSNNDPMRKYYSYVPTSTKRILWPIPSRYHIPQYPVRVELYLHLHWVGVQLIIPSQLHFCISLRWTQQQLCSRSIGFPLLGRSFVRTEYAVRLVDCKLKFFDFVRWRLFATQCKLDFLREPRRRHGWRSRSSQNGCVRIPCQWKWSTNCLNKDPFV